MISDNNVSQEDWVLGRVEKTLNLALKGLGHERDRFKTLTDDSIGGFENIRNTLFSFLGLGFSIIFGLPFVLAEEYDIEPLWLIGVLLLIVLIGSIIYVVTNIYSSKLLRLLTEIDRVYYDGIIALTLIETFLISRTAKIQENLSMKELESLHAYVELLLGGIYCSLDDKYNESIGKVPIARVKRGLQSFSPLDYTFVNELCSSQRKNIESRNIPSLKDILDLHTDFSDVIHKMFINCLYRRCKKID